jgi:hypothetical protein
MIGICAGHEIQSDTKRTFSIEILAVDPQHANKGVAKMMLKSIFKSLNDIEIHLWTRSLDAYAYYKNHLKLEMIDSVSLNKLNEKNAQYWHSESNHSSNTWNFRLTKDSLFLNLSTLKY